jgi:anti-anti-sigma factor
VYGENCKLDVEERGDTVEARISGDLDMAATFRLEPELERLTRRSGVRSLVIDLDGVEFIDSSGLGLLLATHDRLRTAQLELVLANPSASVRRMLELTGAVSDLPVTTPR